LKISDDVYSDCGGGEIECSFRPLIHRKELAYVVMPAAPVTAHPGQVFIGVLVDPGVWPNKNRGYDSIGVSRQLSNVTFLNILMSCFAGWRGSIRETVQIVASSMPTTWDTGSLVIYRQPRPAVYGDVNYTGETSQVTTTATFLPNSFLQENCDAGAEIVFGRGVAPPPVNVEFPFSHCFPIASTASSHQALLHGAFAFYGYAGIPDTLGYKVYQSAGDDFQVFGWVGVPTIYPQPATGITASNWS